MKKILITVLAFSVIASSAFAKKWTNNIGVGFTVPISTVTTKDTTVNKKEIEGEDIKQTGYGVEGTYIGVHESGFTAKADVSIGVATSKDIGLQDEETNIGVFENIYIGAGWSFVNTDNALFGITGMLGVDCSQYTSKEDVKWGTYTSEQTNEFAMVSFGIGADIFGVYRFQPNFGLFANVGVRYLVAGSSKVSSETERKKDGRTEKTSTDFDIDLKGKFTVQPTIGIIWTF